MNLDSLLPLQVPFAQVIAHIGATGGGEAEAISLRLLSKTRDEEIPYNAQVVQILCAACDHYRRAGKMDVVQDVEEMIRVLKQGPRVISGSMLMSGDKLLNQIANKARDGARVVAIEHPDSEDRVVLGTVEK